MIALVQHRHLPLLHPTTNLTKILTLKPNPKPILNTPSSLILKPKFPLYTAKMPKRPSSSSSASLPTASRDPQSRSYEAKRLKRIKENQAVLTGLGINVAAKQNLAKTKRKHIKAAKPKSKKKKQKPARRSRRNQGLDPENFPGLSNAALAEPECAEEGEESRVEEEKRDKALLEKWKAHVLAIGEGECVVEEGERRLFLVPTGVPGVNDHTLEAPVASLDSYLWGFCEGLFSRIFQKVRPGDIFLFTSSGCGEFNRIARVKETRVVGD